MYRANVQGSVNVLEAAAEAGAERLVYTSSVAVLGINPDRSPADETTPVALENMIGHYKRSKFLAEQAVWRRAAELVFSLLAPILIWVLAVVAGWIAIEMYVARPLSTLEAAVAGREYLVGDRFTAADVYVGSHLGWGMQFGTIEKRPAFERYFARLGPRPAAVRAREIDDALVADAKRAASG